MAQPNFILRTVNGELDKAIVVRFTGSEAISNLYQFDVLVKIPDSEILDLDAVLATEAVFSIEHDGKPWRRHGILRSFEMQQTAGGYSYYAACLVPRLWKLTQYPTNEVFIGKDFPQVSGIIDDVLTRAGYSSGSDFDLSSFSATYADRQYTCQFGETDFAFISRQMEREGIWYYFEQGEEAETLVMRDDMDYPALEGDPAVFATNPDDNNRYRSVQAWVCRKQRLPAEVVLRDYNHAQPSLDVSGTAPVDPNGQGSVFIYGENFDSAEEGARLAQVRAGELACRKTVFHGSGAVPGFAAGYTFTLDGHPGQGGAWNGKSYLLVSVTHEGENLDNSVGAAKNAPRYANSFTAIPADVQFRPERVTQKPRFDGTMTAIVHAEDPNATLAEIDETGCYRVRLPFDREGSDGKKASHWIRMAQPYAGAEQGMYFPLKVNTEVLLTFINGDPDRPVIAGAVPNGAGASLLTSNTANQATIATPDLLKTHAAGGAHRNISTARYLRDNGGASNVPPSTPPFTEINPATGEKKGDMSATDEVGGDFIIDRSYGDIYHYGEGNTYAWGAESTFNFGNDYEELHEGLDYVGQEGPGSAAKRYKFEQYTGTYKDDPDAEIFEIPLLGKDREKDEGLIEKNWGNKMEYHFGASYNWAAGYGPGGSRQEFNYGNAYAENLADKMRGTFDSEYPNDRHTHMIDKVTATKALIEKTHGDTYSYQNGVSVEVHEGNSYAESWGDSEETVHGNSDATVHGDSSEMVYGDVKSIVHGSTNDMILGGASEMHLGGANEMFVGGKNEMCVAVVNNMALSAENNMWFGAKTDISVGAVFEMTAGTKIEMDLATKIEVDSIAELRTKVTAIGTALTAIESAATTIANKALDIKNGATSLNFSALKFW